MDLTTLLTVATLFLSVVAGNAALFGESLFASIAVPKSLETAGFDKPTAERLFAGELARYTQHDAILPTPNVTISSRPSIAAALAKPLQMQDVVQAIQSQIRTDVASVSGAIMQTAAGKPLSILMTVHAPPDPPVTVELNQADGEVRALMQSAAREAMIIIAPYRVALTDLSNILAGDPTAIQTAEQTARRGLTQPWDPSIQGATEAALLHNLLGVLATLRNDKAQAQYHFTMVHTTPGAARSAYGLAFMNQAFLALTERRGAEARALFDQGSAKMERHLPTDLTDRFQVLDALIHWQGGNIARAETLLREVAASVPVDVEPLYYLGRLIQERGNATTERAAREAALVKRYDRHYSFLTHTIYGLNVKTGALEPTAFQLDPTPSAQAKPAKP